MELVGQAHLLTAVRWTKAEIGPAQAAQLVRVERQVLAVAVGAPEAVRSCQLQALHVPRPVLPVRPAAAVAPVVPEELEARADTAEAVHLASLYSTERRIPPQSRTIGS